MCSNIRLSKSKSIISGHIATYKTYHSPETTRTGVFGFKGGIIYNVRSDKLQSSRVSGSQSWYAESALRRGLISIIGFRESGVEFELEDGNPMYAAILYNENNEFAIITEPSQGIVGEHHSRMPVLIEDTIQAQINWFIEGKFSHVNPSELKRA